MKKHKIIKLFIAIVLLGVSFCFGAGQVFAVESDYEDGQRLCGTFTYNVVGYPPVSQQDFQICAIIDANGGFKEGLELRADNWNNSINYVDQNGNTINLYDNPDNGALGVGGRPGMVNPFDSQQHHWQYNFRTGEDFVATLRALKDTMNGFTDRRYWPGGGQGYANFEATFTNRITWSTTNPATVAAETSANAAEAGTEASGDACYGNAGSLGWVLCPVVQIVGGAMEGVYQIVEENYLQLPSSTLFNTDPDQGVYVAWSSFRNVANIIFIILFIIVILSQLTGFGIDNYGIKKILPRLIVVAILINLSYIICQLLVDVSNIVGLGLKGFLEGMGSGLSDAVNTNFGVGDIAGGVGIGIVTAGIAGKIIFTNPTILLSLFAAVIGGLVALLFLWVILVVREVAVILAIVIAPVAIACYLLPNTESMAKRWLKLLGTLLLLYPLCSLVIGAGNLTSAILASTSSEWYMAIAAMMVQVLPYFFIPTLLKQSLNGLGALGARISGLGQAARGRTTGAIRGSDAYKRGQQRLNNAGNNLRLGAGKYARSSKGNKFSRGLARVVGGSNRTQRRLARQANEYEQDQIKDIQYSWADENGNTNMNAAMTALEGLSGKKNLNSQERATLRAAMDTITSADATEAMRYLTGEKKDSNGNSILSDSIRQQAAAYVTSTNPQLLGQMKDDDIIRAEYVKNLGANAGATGMDYTAWATRGTGNTVKDAAGNNIAETNAMRALAKASNTEILKQKVSAFDATKDANGHEVNIQKVALSYGRGDVIKQDTRAHTNARQETLNYIQQNA